MNFTSPISRQTMLFIFLLLFAGNGFTQVNLSETIPTDPKIKIGKLENGLTYYIRQNKKPEQKVELRLAVNTGSIMEDEDQQGLAHMAEHMAFNGTKNFKKNDIVSFLQSIGVQFGADLNAYTSFDETVYILPIPTDKPDNLEKGFQVLEDWAHQVSYNDEDIEGERAIILEESRRGKGAQDRIFRKIYPKLFAGSKYADRIPIGVDSIIKTFKPDAIRRFYHDWYRPDLMAVLIVGDVDPAVAEQMIKKHFSGMVNPANERPRDFAKIPPYTSSEAMVVTDKEATQNVMFMQYSARPSKASTTVGDYKKDIIKNIFSALANQRLQELTQKENPPFNFAGVDFGEFVRGYESFGATVVSGTTDPKKSLAAALEEVERIKRFGFTQTELDRAKKSVLANIENSFKEKDKTESDLYVDEYIRNFLTGEPIPGIAKELDYHKTLLPTITLDDVNQMAKELQGDPNYLLALTGSEKSAATFPTNEQLVATVGAVTSKDIKPYEEKQVAASLLEKMPKPGKVVKETADPLMGTKIWTLSNGVQVTIKKTDFKNDELLLGARRPGGLGNYGLADKYNAQYSSTLVNAMGIGSFSPTDLQKVLAGKVASASAAMGPTTDNFSGSSSVKDAETMFQLLYLYATAPRLDTALFNSFRQRAKSQVAFMMANPQTAFQDTLNKVMYANNPLGPEAAPKPEVFDNLDVKRSLAIYKERFSDVTGMQFAIVGNFDEKNLKKLVETYIASLPASGKKFNFKDNGLRPIKGNVNLNYYKGEAEKSQILAIHTGELPYSEDLDMKADAITEILNIRIIEELREKIQGIYSGGMGGGLRKYPYPSYNFRISLPCGPEKVDTLLYAMNTEIENLKKNGPTKAILDKVKQQWLEQNKVAMKENGTWMTEILDVKFPGGDPKRFLEYEKYVKALTPKDVQAAANLLLNNKNVITAVLRPEAMKENKTVATTAAPLPGNRKTEVQKTIELPTADFTVDVYDNGDIDGDIITLFYNGQEVMSKQKLTDKPVSIKLRAGDNSNNELVMFAENLGSVPPNTALAIVTCGGQRFEVRISSDTEKSGAVQFRVKK